MVGPRDDGVGAATRAGLRHDLGRRSRVLLERHLGALGGDLVEPGGEPLGQAAGVGEHDRRPVLLDQVDDPLLDVRPDRAAPVGGRGGALAGLLGHGTELGHVLDRHDHLEVPLLGGGGRDDLDRAGPAEEPGDLVDRAHGRGQPDPLGRPLEQLVEALQRQREVGAALGAGDRVHLVDDHALDPAQGLARLAGEHQEQRLGRGDQNVRRRGRHPPPVGRRGVAGADADGEVGDRVAEPLGGVPDAGQRRPQVALDVDGQRLERGDVEHPAAGLLVRRRLLARELVQRPQERREGLAGPGGRHDEGVAPGGHRPPGTLLGRRRRGEGGPEPRAGRRAEHVQHVVASALVHHPSILPEGTDRSGRSGLRPAGRRARAAYPPAADPC